MIGTWVAIVFIGMLIYCALIISYQNNIKSERRYWNFRIFIINTIVPFNAILSLIDNDYQWIYSYLNDSNSVREEWL